MFEQTNAISPLMSYTDKNESKEWSLNKYIISIKTLFDKKSKVYIILIRFLLSQYW